MHKKINSYYRSKFSGLYCREYVNFIYNRVDQAMCPFAFQHNECCRLIARVIRLYS